MADITLGADVHSLKVRLTRGADFVSVLTNSEPWGTAAVELRFSNGETWAASVSGNDATFDVDEAAVNTMIDSRTKKVRLYVVDGSNDECWAIGQVAVA